MRPAEIEHGNARHHSSALRRGPAERASTLLLFPAAVLIVVVLAAIVVDSSIAFLGERELAQATAAAANDAATQAISDRAFYQGDHIQLDADTVERVAVRSVLTSVDDDRHHDIVVEATAIPPSDPGCPWAVRVSAAATVDYLFARAIPGGPRQARVEATSTATPREDGRESCLGG